MCTQGERKKDRKDKVKRSKDEREKKDRRE
jgi:hypothetical protein